ncbi:MAG: hypothetical protein R1F54_10745 [Candidatus Zeuxoniibacter abyssi]|nr:MAG: hypothetical protein R1F54_10745 [Candidatus Persebacteraceae bacterium AB1(2)]
MTKFQMTISDVQVMQTWTLLMCAARDRKIYTDEELGKIINAIPVNVVDILRPIMKFCEKKEYPKLTILIVNANTRLPGIGLRGIDKTKIGEETEKIYEYPWLSVGVPDINDFKKADKE